MAKQLKINIKNAQIAQGLQIGKKEETVEESRETVEKESRPKRERSTTPKVAQPVPSAELKPVAKDSAKKEEVPRSKARTKSAFSGPVAESSKPKESPKESKEAEKRPVESPTNKGNAALRRELFGEDAEEEIVRSQKASKRPNPLLANLEEMAAVEEKSSAAPQERTDKTETSQKESIPHAFGKPVEQTTPPTTQTPQPKAETSRSTNSSSIPPPPLRQQATSEQSNIQTPLSRSFDQPRTQSRDSHGPRREGYTPREPYNKERGPRDYAPREQGPREQGSRDFVRREHTPREHSPREYNQGPREYTPREQGSGTRDQPRGPGAYAPREYRGPRDQNRGPGVQGPREYTPREQGQGPREYTPREYTPREPGTGRSHYGQDQGRPPYGPRRDDFQGHGPRSTTGEPRVKLGPTGKHINDFLPPRYQPKSRGDKEVLPMQAAPAKALEGKGISDRHKSPKGKSKPGFGTALEDELSKGSPSKAGKSTFSDVKPVRKKETSFDARDRYGLRATDEDGNTHWKKRRHAKVVIQEDTTIRPTHLKIRVPIILKDLAAEMKLKSSQLVAKLFLQGVTVTLNDILEDEIVIQLLGQEFGCNIQIDTSAEERIRITDKTIKEEISQFDEEQKSLRAPIVAFMGHVDHGKTSLIDAIRKSNRAAGEAGAITQHIGAFRCQTKIGEITILDTPGHEAFSAMRARGADVTDIVVLVIAGDEGIRAQTVEAIQHAKTAGVTIVVALNKSDKPNFNPENVYRQLADQELLPEAWGGNVITVNCSAVTGEGIETLLEMLAIQAEILELKSVRNTRARGRVLESEMHKGLGSVATVLVQNGTLRKSDCVVFDQHWGRIKTMQDEHGVELSEAGPSTPVSITGLSGLPEAGHEFIVVKNEREAREISEARMAGVRLLQMQQKKKVTIESLMQQTTVPKKVLNIILRADVQGSLEALKVALQKIESSKVELNIILAGVGEVSESDVQLATTSKAVIVGFHTRVESHTEPAIKQLGVQVKLHDIIYHAIDDVKVLMSGLLDKIAKEETRGNAIVKATFKSSQHGVIAGCQVTEGTIHRNYHIRVIRKGEMIWKGSIQSLKRVKEDVREVQKGVECGILLNNYNELMEGDNLEAYEIIYLTQEL